MPSYIPQRVKRARQQITVKLYEDQLAMLNSYGRFINDSRDYIISQALEVVFKKDKEFAYWLEQQREGAEDNAKSMAGHDEVSVAQGGPQVEEEGRPAASGTDRRHAQRERGGTIPTEARP